MRPRYWIKLNLGILVRLLRTLANVGDTAFENIVKKNEMLVTRSTEIGYNLKYVAQLIFVAFVADNANMSLTGYFENHVSYFVQNGRK